MNFSQSLSDPIPLKEKKSELIETGFEYICENNGLKFFRKPK
jgi:hypothetical protein